MGPNNEIVRRFTMRYFPHMENKSDTDIDIITDTLVYKETGDNHHQLLRVGHQARIRESPASSAGRSQQTGAGTLQWSL